MSSHSAANSNIHNRSPWLVRVRTQPDLDKRFRFAQLPDAERYCAALGARGVKSKLTVADINFEMRYAHLKDTKNGRSRKVPLTARAMQVFRALLALQSPTVWNGHFHTLARRTMSSVERHNFRKIRFNYARKVRRELRQNDRRRHRQKYRVR